MLCRRATTYQLGSIARRIIHSSSSTTPIRRAVTNYTPKVFPSQTRKMTSFHSNEELKSNVLFDVSHVTAVVTGGGTGIGLMIAQALQSNGAKVYITGRRKEALDNVVKEYSTGPGQIIALPGDITSKDECVRLAREVGEKEPKGIHLLVNNAGVARDDKTKFSSAGEPDFTSADAVSEHLLKSDPAAWDETFKTNVTAHYFMSAAFIPLLGKARAETPGYSSQIVNVSSISGLMKGSSMGQPAYATSKAAAVHLTRVLSTLLIKTKIRVNQVAPGIFPSEMTAGKSDEKNKNRLESSSNPAGRPGNDQDMAATILFLAGKGGVFYNNQILHPDGGNMVVQPAAI
ncbi:hypothetical protein MCOR04_002307 [Pyricularia oryzae]|nr:hypothetical protein MCOR04_002307 [Pyricularia oryzae]